MKIASSINSICNNKNNFTQNNKNKKVQAEFKPQEKFKPVNRCFLSSKFNVNFCSNANTVELYNDTKRFSKHLENKIKAMLKIEEAGNDKDNNCAIKSSTDVDLISRQFKIDKITDIFNTNVSLNGAIDYLSIKKQVATAQNLYCQGLIPKKTAFLIDRLSIEYIKNSKTKNSCEFRTLLNAINNNSIKFYCLVQDKKEAEKLIEELSKVLKKDISKNTTLIFNAKTENKANFPDAQTIENAIKIFSNTRFPDNETKRKRLESEICKYLDELFIGFSYQSLAEIAKMQHRIIEIEARMASKSIDNIVYLIPFPGKSYDLINYIYAQVNNISADRFIRLNECQKGNEKIGNDKFCVILDDIIASGGSIRELAELYSSVFNNAKNLDVLLVPLVSSKYSLETHSEKPLEKKGKISASITPIKVFKDFRYIDFYESEKEALNRDEQKGMQKIIDNYYEKYRVLDKKDITDLRNSLSRGCGGIYSCALFPYMIPDNSSNIAAVLGGYFLNNDNPKANRAVEPFNEIKQGSRITQRDYTQIKQMIDLIKN